MSLEYIRNYYGVPAWLGARVVYNSLVGPPIEGVITGASGPHILIRMDSSERSSPFHPTWRIKYIESEVLK